MMMLSNGAEKLLRINKIVIEMQKDALHAWNKDRSDKEKEARYYAFVDLRDRILEELEDDADVS